MVREGYGYGMPLLLAAAGLLALHLYVPGTVFLVLAALVLNFFRDPDRDVPQTPGLIVSPADGRIVQVVDETHEGRPVRRLSIFMSPLDVHVNRAPIAGVIESVSYRKGTFGIAAKDEASIENEQNVFTLAGEQDKVIVKQIAGVVARRIVFWKRVGDRLARGERVGLIKFGSRVDVLFEPGIKLRVKVGDRVRAGSTILGTTEPSA
jgi:phosphatidylserine decarboxylase